MIRIQGIDHVVLRAADPAAMLRFYRDALGCPVERERPGLVQLRAGDGLIDLVPADGGPPSQDGRNMEHLCLRIEPVDEAALAARLTELGIEAPAFERRYGARGYGRSVYISDPEGNVVELKIDASG